jgi:rhodanese-related sulfurtransferase
MRITADEVKVRVDRGEPIAFVDARTGPAWTEAETKLPRAVRVPPDDIEPHIDELPRDRTIVVYCSCPLERSSLRVAQQLRNHGYRDVRVLAGGIEQWRLSGYPLEKRALRVGGR